MTTDTLIGDILRREGGYVDHPADTGGPTKYGITARTLGEWRSLNRPATRAEVQALTRAEAETICRLRYLERPGFHRIAYAPLQAQMVDFAYHSGPALAVRWLQRVIGAPVTGVFDATTAAELGRHDQRIVNDALVAARLYMVERVTDTTPSQRVFEEGWEGRALEFFLSRPEA